MFIGEHMRTAILFALALISPVSLALDINGYGLERLDKKSILMFYNNQEFRYWEEELVGVYDHTKDKWGNEKGVHEIDKNGLVLYLSNGRKCTLDVRVINDNYLIQNIDGYKIGPCSGGVFKIKGKLKYPNSDQEAGT